MSYNAEKVKAECIEKHGEDYTFRDWLGNRGEDADEVIGLCKACGIVVTRWTFNGLDLCTPCANKYWY